MEALSLQAEKSALRREFRDARARFAAANGPAASARLTEHLRRLLGDLSSVGHQVTLYRARPDEAQANLAPLSEYYYPRLTGKGRMEFLRPKHADAFELNSFQIPEPIQHSAERLDPRRPVIICCPAVAIDWQGGRIGMGKGYYDRFFQDHPKAVRVGLVYQVQMSKAPLPVESWDQPLDWIVTDKMILRPAKRSS